jgi:hypothetical protein
MTLPSAQSLIQAAERAREDFRSDPEATRPRDSRGESGGLVELDPSLPTFVLTDLHARADLIRAALDHEYGGTAVWDLLAAGRPSC